jgi:Ca2+-binding RTX toxin-like protein
VESVALANGVTWTAADLRARVLDAAGTAGNDTITGFNTADTLRGRAGNDTLTGGDGSDTFIWARGDGNDTITADGAWSGSADRLVLEGIAASAVTLVRSGNDLTLRIAATNGGTNGGSVLMREQLASYYDQGVESVALANGVTWTAADLRARVLDAAGTAGNDTITGFNTADTLRGRAGNDTLTGGDGNDIFAFQNIGDGRDVIVDFVRGADRIDMSSLFAATTESGKGIGDLTASGHLSVQHGAFATGSATNAVSTDTAIYADTDGRGPNAAVLLAIVEDVNLTASDFIL